MTTREKIIVGIMCLTIVYGAYELLMPKGKKPSTSREKADPSVELNAFVTEVTKKMANTGQGESYRYIVDKAGAEWTKDPFLQSVTPLKKSPTAIATAKQAITVRPAPRLVYTGYLQLGGTKIAIINDMEYAVGEKLNSNGLYVKSISAERVIVGKIGSEQTIRLPLTETD